MEVAMKLSLLTGASLLAFAGSLSVASATPTTFNFTGGFQTYTAPTTGPYDISPLAPRTASPTAMQAARAR